MPVRCESKNEENTLFIVPGPCLPQRTGDSAALGWAVHTGRPSPCMQLGLSRKIKIRTGIEGGLGGSVEELKISVHSFKNSNTFGFFHQKCVLSQYPSLKVMIKPLTHWPDYTVLALYSFMWRYQLMTCVLSHKRFTHKPTITTYRSECCQRKENSDL